MNKKKYYILSTLIAVLVMGNAPLQAQLVTEKPTTFNLADAVICVDTADYTLVNKAATFLQQDIEMVTGKRPAIVHNFSQNNVNYIIIGSRDHSSLIEALNRAGKLNTKNLNNQWEAFQLRTIKGISASSKEKYALVISGSDRRGTAYGVFELSRQMGVSPWYWWADVPVKKQPAVYINTTTVMGDAPKVKYRGIFINDEAPALSGWTKEKFGGMNHQFYEKVFELLLRLKANYLWPAMWGNAFNDDDKMNPVLANEYGIVMGTSHHEPMLRAQQEWKRYGKGAWDYTKNDTILRQFWQKGMENMGNHESIVTVGMRGDGDMPMTQGTATALLERIVADQRKIIEDVTKKPAAATPQLWALYKEVQDYYDKGMQVPDDVTLLLCDDNWGNIRKLPPLNAKPRKGGYGIYYHFDYVGGPRNYKWINTNSIPRVWEQMHLAYEYNVRNIWIVNVGDIKPMEFPISFFLDYAWNPEKIGPADIRTYTEKWSAAQFGKDFAKPVSDILLKYSKYNSRRKPEMVDASTYSFNYGEWYTIVDDYNELLKKAELINTKLPASYRDAYYQLVMHPVKASANLNEMYFNVALNKDAYDHKWTETNTYADKVKELYANDSLITIEYNQLNKGKWNHMMDQKHIGYRSWQEPRQQVMPAVKYLPLDSAITAYDSAMFLQKARYPANIQYPVFYEQNRLVSIGADHYSRVINGNGIKWTILPDHGRTGSAITIFPVTAPAQKATATAPHVEYDFYSISKDSVTINAYFSPTLNFLNTEEGLQYAIAIDNETPQVISINKQSQATEGGIMYKWVGDNIIIKNSRHRIATAGKHTVKCWIINPGVVLQKLVLDFGNVKQTYLGPPETINK